jgi:hypothetical protein
MAKSFTFTVIRRCRFQWTPIALLVLTHAFILSSTPDVGAHALRQLVDKPMTLEKFEAIEGKAADYGFEQEKIQDYSYTEVGDFLLVRSAASADCDKDVCRSVAVFRGKISSAMYLPAEYFVSDNIPNISGEQFIDLYFSTNGVEWGGFLIGENRLIVRSIHSPYAPRTNAEHVEQ